MNELREYQQRWVRDIWEAWKTHRRILAVLPSGTGKTVAYVRIVQQSVFKGERVLILVTRREILRQTYERLIADGLDAKRIGVIWQKDKRENAAADVQLASVDTLARRTCPKADRVIVDEAHHAVAPKFSKILSWYQEVPILGVTATPCRLDGKPLDAVFDTLVIGAQPSELIKAGYLARAAVWTKPGQTIDLKGVRSRGGDYAVNELGKRLSKRTIVGDIPAHWKEHADGRPTIVFAATVAHGKKIQKAFGRVRTELLTGETPDRVRREMIGPKGRLARGVTKVVVTCDTVSEGWDLPAAKCAILARPTLSLSRYLQQCARVLRPGDKTPIILDHAGNARRFGLLPDHDIEWSLNSRVRGGGGGVDPGPDGRLVEREPTFVDGKLVEFDAVRCSMCERPATYKSARAHIRRGYKPYCAEHRGGPWAPLPALPCSVCGDPSTKKSSDSARYRNSRSYCSEHRGGPKATLPALPCAVCGNPSTRANSRCARYRDSKPYCSEHAGGHVTPPLPCAICKSPSTKKSSARGRRGVSKPYCSEHAGGQLAMVPWLGCAICGNPSTRNSCQNARRSGGKPYCAAHKRGRVTPRERATAGR